MKTEVGCSSEKFVSVEPHGVASVKTIALILIMNAGIQPVMS
jgi:hypothetical protein